MSEEQRPVLILAGNHTTQPLWRGLSDHFDLCITHAQMASLAADVGIPGAYGMGKYMSAEAQEWAVNMAYHLSAIVQMDENVNALGQIITQAFSGSKVPNNFTEPYVHEWFPGFVGEHIRNQAVMLALTEKAIGDRKVAGCIVHEDVTPDMRALVRTCQQHGIPTIHIPHANCFYVGEKWDIHTESISDHILASGDYMRDWYLKWGYTGGIRVTGAPQWDGMFKDRPSRKEARGVLGKWITEDEFILVYATTWGQLTSSRSGATSEEVLSNLTGAIEAAKELGATLCIKMHPGEAQGNEQGYLNELKKAGVNGFITRAYNEYVLAAADCLLSHAPSNLCVQAAIWGVPCAYCPTEDYEFPFPGPVTVRENATWAVKMAMRVEKTWEHFAKNCNDAYPNGDACERIVKEVVDICR